MTKAIFLCILSLLLGSYNIQDSGDGQLKSLENALTLKAVTITGKRDDFLYGRRLGPNECGDYVCRYGFLNCSVHNGDPDNHTPVKGKAYKDGRNTISPSDEKVPIIIYTGCIQEPPFLFKVSGIYLDREFYGVNAEVEDLSQPQYLSTLFWQPGTLFDINGETEFSFLTGDITGDFSIVVQGVGEKDLIYGEWKLIVQ